MTNEAYSQRLRGLDFISSTELQNKISSGLYAKHPIYPILVNQDGTEIISLIDGAVIPILNIWKNKKRTIIRKKVRLKGIKGRIHVHTIVYEAWHKDIVSEGHEIHHRDFNRENNYYTNLEKLDSYTHREIHGLL